MRVAVTIESFGSGGAEASTRQICEGLRDRGCEVSLAVGWCPPGTGVEGVRIAAAGDRRVKSARDVRAYRAFARAQLSADSLDTSLSVTTLCPAAVVEPRAGIYREMWQRFRRPSSLAPKRRAMWDAEAATLADPSVQTWVAISRFMQQQISRHTGRPEPRVPVIANGAPSQAAPAGDGARRKQRLAWGVPENARVHLFAGSDGRRKGLPTLLAAWPKVRKKDPDAWLVALGPRPAKRDTQRRISWEPLSHDMPAAFAGADVLVLPSRYDPASKIVAEALLAGLPVITTRSNGACDLLESSAAGEILEDPLDDEALADAMLRFASPDRLAAAREATREAARGATMERHVDELLKVLQAAAGAGG